MNTNIKDILGTDLDKVNEHINKILLSGCENADVAEIINWVLLSKGKQLRPILTILSSRFCKRPKDVSEFAASIEIIHMASLVHDDVIDNADERRGQMSVQKKFGKEMAIYAGDYMIFSLASNTTFKPSLRHREYISLISKLCMGELAQHHNLHNKNITVEQYLSNIENKTAVLFQCACLMGSSEGGCSKRRIKTLSEFGKNLGMIFQLRDDLLDYLSNKKAEGKPTDNDIISGIYALPLIAAFNGKYSENVKHAVNNYKDNPTIENREVIIEYIYKSNGFELTRSKIDEYKAKAFECLCKLPNTAEKKCMEDILNYISDMDALSK